MRGDNANVQVRYGDRILGTYTRAGPRGRDRFNGPVRALPDPFARDPEVSSDLCQGLRTAPGQSEASFQHLAVALVRNRRHRRGHQPPHALARPCQNLPEIPGIRHIGEPWHGALRRPVIEQQTVMRLVKTASAFPENADGELHQVAERRTGEEPGPPLAELAAVDPLPDVEHLADVRCRGVAGSPEPRLPGRGWAGGVRQSKQGSASLAVIQPSCSSSGISSLAGIILSSRDTMAPASARAVPRSPRGRRPPAPPRRAPRLPPASTAPPGRQAEHHRHPRQQIRWSHTDNAPVRGDAARGELPRSSPSRGLLEGVRIDDTDPDPAATRRPSSAT